MPAAQPAGLVRPRVDHVIIVDGTLNSLTKGMDSNAGILCRLLREGGRKADRTVYYEPGLQWQGWKRSLDLARGRGIDDQIQVAYGHLASQYRPGDRIFLFGYSRGAYAVRSLAGVIDRVGLLTQQQATERNVRLAFRHYRLGPDHDAAREFARANCHLQTPIEMVGVWETVKALGLRVPLLWMLTEQAYAFHNHQLGTSIRHGFHALALDETRQVFAPVLWDCPSGWEGNVEQVWFRGAHADIGGQTGGFDASRPLANIPLVWMLDRADGLGLGLPPGWRERFPCDPAAPMIGSWRGWGRLFLYRRPRVVGRDRSEHLHPSAPPLARRRWRTFESRPERRS